MRKWSRAQYIKADPNIQGPFVLVSSRIPNLMELRGMGGEQHTHWWLSFNGNSKQRRQQQRQLLRTLNK